MQLEKMTDKQIQLEHDQARYDLKHANTLKDYKSKQAKMAKLYFEMQKRGIGVLPEARKVL